MGASLPSAGDSYFCSDQVEEAKFAFGAEELLLYLQHEKVRPMIETAAFGLEQACRADTMERLMPACSQGFGQSGGF